MSIPARENLPPLEGVFFIMPANRHWLETGQGHITTPSYEEWRFIFLVGLAVIIPGGVISAIMLGIVAVRPSEEAQTMLSVCGIPTLLGMLAYLIPAYVRARLRRLEGEGELIIGEVVYYGLPYGWFGRPWDLNVVRPPHIVYLRYRMTLPLGEEVVGLRRYSYAIFAREKPVYREVDMPGGRLSRLESIFLKPIEPGTKLAILYLSKAHHEIL